MAQALGPGHAEKRPGSPKYNTNACSDALKYNTIVCSNAAHYGSSYAPAEERPSSSTSNVSEVMPWLTTLASMRASSAIGWAPWATRQQDVGGFVARARSNAVRGACRTACAGSNTAGYAPKEWLRRIAHVADVSQPRAVPPHQSCSRLLIDHDDGSAALRRPGASTVVANTVEITLSFEHGGK